ncbi:class I SAM-dependent methyltransferase [Kutzneria kofuensis]|uniref:2-polyprenyl-3-methyl-5-hydroxy-6-metoxy-1, 4-benzoquinol methylase n=1 Tax=Kutzneria kofuensis TaxID=103725 RepID=A0A7W9KFI8_9PSEU|nr:class I SAM-dependent methyltransferase [Kutzneria kofuensis]MBB5890899.1 2-polyprenyl-3-methyl-5-hydroxy-6-metoxy-1,4-benzoquinol methylase [Kutzneria kofuensis]
MVVTAVEHWRQALGEWRIPQNILDRVAESPWVLPRQVFIRRADAQIANPIGATFHRASAALSEPGAVLDVGAAAGATSLPLAAAGRVTHLTAVDADSALLDACATRAAQIGVPFERMEGLWPDSAVKAPIADIVICGNVLYNVADLEPFVAALTDHARHLVAAEVAIRHPLTELNPLWRRFHGIARPDGPGVDDLVAALDELGIHPDVARWSRPPEAEYANFAELVDVARRRLCLPPDAAPEVDRALRDLGHSPDLVPDLGSSGRDLATLTWPGRAD